MGVRMMYDLILLKSVGDEDVDADALDASQQDEAEHGADEQPDACGDDRADDEAAKTPSRPMLLELSQFRFVVSLWGFTQL